MGSRNITDYFSVVKNPVCERNLKSDLLTAKSNVKSSPAEITHYFTYINRKNEEEQTIHIVENVAQTVEITTEPSKETTPIKRKGSLTEVNEERRSSNKKNRSQRTVPEKFEVRRRIIDKHVNFEEKVEKYEDKRSYSDIKLEEIMTETSCVGLISPLSTSPVKSSPPTSSSNANKDDKKSLSEVRSILKSCPKLSELREKLLEINNCEKKLAEFQRISASPKKLKLQNFVSPIKDIKIQSPFNAYLSPMKILKANDEKISSEAKKHVMRKLDFSESEPRLELPYKFRSLEEFFSTMDLVVSMMFNKNETCYFCRVRESVQKMLRRSFDQGKLSSIATLANDMYRFQFDQNSTITGMTNSMQKNYDRLVIKPILAGNISKMTPSLLTARKEAFHVKLLDLVKVHHKKFLESLSTPIEISEDSLTRWHRDFPLQEVPDVVFNEDALPKLSTNNVKTDESTFNSVFKKASIDMETKPFVPSHDNITNGKIAQGPLKGLPAEFVDFIKAKSKETMRREMTRSKEVEKKIAMIKHLPEMMSIIKNYFTGESRAAQLLESTVDQVLKNYHTHISRDDVRQHIKLLAELLPNWIYLLNVRDKEYVKIDKSRQFSDLYDKLEKCSARLKDC